MVTIRGLFRTQISKIIFFWKHLTALSKKLRLRCLCLWQKHLFWICLWQRSLKYCHFKISKNLIMLFSYYFHFPCIILSKVYFYIVCPMFLFLFNWSRSKVSVVNQMSIFFLKLKNIFYLFPPFWKWSYSQRCFDVDQRYETRRWK